jgi:hypothetical protein
MPSLPELQQRFASAIDEPGETASGFEVYRHAIKTNYRRALAATYPVARALVGAPFFDAAVDAFTAAHPSSSGDLNDYGGAFGDFLERHEPASTLPYLPDVARLEWALDESARAADVDTDPQAVVAAISLVEEDAVPQIRLMLHPSCRLVASRYAVFDIWRAHQADQPAEKRVDPEGGATEHLLTRSCADAPVVERLAAGEFAWLHALRAGDPFGAALARAMEVDAQFDLAAALQGRVMDGTVSGLAP